MATCPKCDGTYGEEEQFCPADGAQLIPESALPKEDADLDAGAMVGEYKVLGLLGKGGFGTVYRGVHPLIGKKVAIKVLHRQLSSNRNMVSRFIAEARAVNQIGHRNIIDIFAFGQLPEGRQYYVMELVDGVSLERYLSNRGRLSIQEAVPILRAVGRALDAAHGAGIAHRDLKPENIVICAEDGKAFPKLLDFGIAKLMGSGDGQSVKTQTGTAMGTPSYMSPEQCLGKNVDHRTDIYAFGVMAYQLLTGKLPFTGESFVEIVVKQTSHEPLAPSQVCEDIPEPLSSAILWMLKKDPNERPQTLAAAVARLEEGAYSMGLAVHTGVTRIPDQMQELNRPMGLATPAPFTGAGLAGGPAVTLAPGTTPARTGGATGGASRSNSPAPTPVAAGELAEPDDLDLPRATPRGKWLAVAAAVIVLGGGGAFLALGRGGAGASPVAASPGSGPRLVDPSAAEPATAPVPTPAPVPATPDPTPAATPVPATPATVTLNIVGTPDQTEVRDERGTLLGRAPGRLALPRGEAAIVLRFEHPGYEPRAEKVAVDRDGELEVKLQRSRSSNKKKPGATTAAPESAPPGTTVVAKPPEPVKPPPPANPLPEF